MGVITFIALLIILIPLLFTSRHRIESVKFAKEPAFPGHVFTPVVAKEKA